VWIVADDLTRVQDVRWIERILNFAEDLHQLAVLTRQELGAR
jgi:hypothetical protein